MNMGGRSGDRYRIHTHIRVRVGVCEDGKVELRLDIRWTSDTKSQMFPHTGAKEEFEILKKLWCWM